MAEEGTKVAEQTETPNGSEAEAGNKAAEQTDNITDKHGHPGISQGKYERDIAAKDAKIAELEGKLEEAAKTEEGRADLKKEIAELRAEQTEERVAHKLELAGCKSVKAAKALLEDYEGDVDKLKAAHPYLFEPEKPKGSLGVKPGGATKMTRDQIMGIEDKDKRLKAIAENMDLFE